MTGTKNGDVAIIGMACIFPGAENLQRYWENILNKVDAVSDPPPDWEAELFYDPQSEANDRTYCKRGGWLGKLAAFDPLQYKVMPSAVDGAEPEHFLALHTAHEALADAGYRDVARLGESTAVIIGRGTYVNRGNAAALQQGVIVDSVLRILKQLHPEHTDEELAEIKRRMKASLPGFHPDTAPGLVPNIITGRICNRMDLMGPNYLVDAACASSLVAVELAMRELQSGRCNMAIAGGVHASSSPVLMMIFSQLKALSRTGQIRPFDEQADGTLMGEGVGLVVLKRPEDAERDGDRIYAILKGVGVASDGRAVGLVAPRMEGEELALKRAYESSGVDPASVELVEAHGTGTPLGDSVEIQALRRVFGGRRRESPRCALGTVKSMISHLMPAAGIAGLIKTALALHHKVLPPTLHCKNPNPRLELEKTNFYINTETRPWVHGGTAAPRRAGVNAFGFGGINAHAVMEEYTGANSAPWLHHNWDSELFVLSGATRGALIEDAERLLQHVTERLLQHVAGAGAEISLKDLAWSVNCTRPIEASRLAVIATSAEDLKAKLQRAIGRLRKERTERIREMEGIYYFARPLAKDGKLAFVFPGEGSQYRNMLADLCIHFPEVRRIFDLMDRAFEKHPRGYLPSEVIFRPPTMADGPDRIWNMDSGAEAVFCANQAMHALVDKLQIRADAMVGHSTGEHSALLASGTVLADSEEHLLAHIAGVYEVFEKLQADSGIPEALLLAVAGADHAFLEREVAESNGQLHIALDNCIHQVVLCGSEAAIDGLLAKLAEKAAVCQKLPFGRAYHTPWFEVFSRPLRHHFDRIKIDKPRVSLYSCVTADRYPDEADEIRRLASVQWASTVRFRETVEAMYRDGVRIFVEVGPRGNLTGFIDDVLRSQPHAAIPSNVHHRSGIQQLHHLLGQLVAHGVELRLETLYERRAPGYTEPEAKPRQRMVLSTGIQPIRLPKEFSPIAKKKTAGETPAPPDGAPPGTPFKNGRVEILQRHLETMGQFLNLQQQMMSAYLQRRNGSQTVHSPFFRDVIELEPGRRATARHTFSLDRERLFLHHTFGRDVSTDDPSLLGLPLVPLTVSMEMLAEAAALLEPGKVVVGMREIRANRWITLEQTDYTIEAVAEQTAPGEVHVLMRDSTGAAGVRPVLAEATILFADAYPDAGPPRPFTLENERPSAWRPEQLYRTGMFHGPLLQGSKSVERTGRNGCSATLEVLPHDSLFAGEPNPRFLLDPVLLDAAGQIVAYWFWEAIETSTDLFPYRVAALDCYAPPPAAGRQMECRVTRKFESDREIHSDIEILDAAGKLYYRLETWETRRFPQPPRFLQLRVSPRETCVSTPWPEPVPAPLRGTHVCCRIDEQAGPTGPAPSMTPEFLDASHGIWLKALAYLVLSPQERAVWQQMQATAVSKRRQEWLLGRCAAKDAVRMLIKERFGVQLCAADVVISTDNFGRPVVEGVWTARLGARPVISISHTRGIAAALAALESDQMVGIDIESMAHRPRGAEAIAFTQAERRWLDALGQEQRDEWSLRLWCAKESAAKALGRGFTGGLHSVQAVRAQLDTGLVEIEIGDGAPLVAYTTREREFVTATAFWTAAALLPLYSAEALLPRAPEQGSGA